MGHTLLRAAGREFNADGVITINSDKVVFKRFVMCRNSLADIAASTAIRTAVRGLAHLIYPSFGVCASERCQELMSPPDEYMVRTAICDSQSLLNVSTTYGGNDVSFHPRETAVTCLLTLYPEPRNGTDPDLS